MRIAVALLACLGAGALTSTLADPSTEAAPTATAAPAASAAATPGPAAAPEAAVAARATGAKEELDKDTQHFLAIGYKPEMHGGEQIYCRKETALGSRLSPLKNCGTIAELRLSKEQTKAGVDDTQRRHAGCIQSGKGANCGN